VTLNITKIIKMVLYTAGWYAEWFLYMLTVEN